VTAPGSGSSVLAGKVALVTGGSRGLGREMALGMARAGADVAIVSRKVDSCAVVAEEIERTTGRRAFPIGCHVGHWQEIDPMVDAVYAELGRVDVLVNNAGMSPLYPSLVEVTEDLFDKIIGVNLKGPFRLGALVGSRMAAGEGGSIINISSVAAIRPTQYELPYAAAKSGLDRLTVGLAREYGPSVRVNSIMCGPFLTDIATAWDPDAFNELVKAYPSKRGGQPSEIVGTALYLASDASSYTTGTIVRVDGGQAIAY
jgi:NAD(P)-dependent dehydrogenase (short-subunit alcohol dehydrogenase family)